MIQTQILENSIQFKERKKKSSQVVTQRNKSTRMNYFEDLNGGIWGDFKTLNTERTRGDTLSARVTITTTTIDLAHTFLTVFLRSLPCFYLSTFSLLYRK